MRTASPERVLDLSLEVYDGFQSHATHARTTVMDYVTHAFSAPRYVAPCRGFATKLLVMSDHVGTHVDAPYHFVPEGVTIEEVPPASLIGPAVVLDATAHMVADRPATAETLERAAAAQGVKIEEGDIAVVRVWKGGWGDPGFAHAKGVDETGAAWLLERGVKAVGIDIAYFEGDLADLRRPVHMLVLGHGIPIVENLINLERIPAGRFTFVGLPLRIRGATGSPIRAVAVLD